MRPAAGEQRGPSNGGPLAQGAAQGPVWRVPLVSGRARSKHHQRTTVTDLPWIRHNASSCRAFCCVPAMPTLPSPPHHLSSTNNTGLKDTLQNRKKSRSIGQWQVREGFQTAMFAAAESLPSMRQCSGPYPPLHAASTAAVIASVAAAPALFNTDPNKTVLVGRRPTTSVPPALLRMHCSPTLLLCYGDCPNSRFHPLIPCTDATRTPPAGFSQGATIGWGVAVSPWPRPDLFAAVCLMRCQLLTWAHFPCGHSD